MIRLRIPKKLKPFFKKPKRFKVAYGGRGGAKSVSFAKGFSMFAAAGNLVGCFREYQNSINESVYSLLVKQIIDGEIPGYKINKKEINHISGGGMRFKGLAHSIESVKSMHGFNFFWLEEGQFISEDSLKILTPTLREEDSEMWISANALSSADPFSQRFIVPYLTDLEKTGYYEDDLHIIVKINYHDNPWFPQSLELERRHDFKTLPRALYDHIWKGAFNDSVEDSIILTEWFDAAIDSHKKLGWQPTGAVVAAHDPSDLGTDDKAVVVRHGSLILTAESRSFGDVNDGCSWAMDMAVGRQADLFVWDADGMGAGLKRQVEKALSGRKTDYRPFYGAETPDLPNAVYQGAENGEKPQAKKNKDIFKNKRAQYYWRLRNRFYNTYLAVEKKQYIDPDKMISIPSDLKDLRLLRSEVCRIPRVYNDQGKIQIMSKIKMKKLKIQSPNLADAIMMSMVMNQPTGTGVRAAPKGIKNFF